MSMMFKNWVQVLENGRAMEHGPEMSIKGVSCNIKLFGSDIPTLHRHGISIYFPRKMVLDLTLT